MENEGFRLIVRRGPRPNEVYELSGDVLNLGRDITNDIVINDREVSRHHLRFTKGADGFTLEDLGSTNGTFVNGKRVSGSLALKNGDMVGLGETVTLQYESNAAGEGAVPATAPPQGQAQPQAPSQPAPQPQGDEQFRPPQQQQTPQAPSQPSPPPQQAVQDPYRPPQQQQAPQSEPAPQYQQADAYAPPAEYYDAQGGAAASYGPPPPGYDYDPYAMREDEGGNTMQWLLIGCLGLLLLCCCLTVVAAVAIDSFCLYESIPILSDVLEALAIPVNCPV